MWQGMGELRIKNYEIRIWVRQGKVSGMSLLHRKAGAGAMGIVSVFRGGGIPRHEVPPLGR